MSDNAWVIRSTSPHPLPDRPPVVTYWLGWSNSFSSSIADAHGFPTKTEALKEMRSRFGRDPRKELVQR